MELFEVNSRIYTSDDLASAIKELGIEKGDMICVHSNFTQFGKILPRKNEFLSVLIDIFKELVGDEGTILVPTFTYSFCRGLCFDKKHSKTSVGALGEYFRKENGVYRNDDPIFSHAIWGAKTELFKTEFRECFGKNSAFDIMYENNAKFIMLGLGAEGFTFYMYIEQNIGVNYRYLKKFIGQIIDENGAKKESEILYFVRNLDMNPIPDREKRLNFMIANQAAKKTDFGASNIVLIDARKSFEVLSKKLKEDEKYFLKESK